jgi:hypothetical protein
MIFLVPIAIIIIVYILLKSKKSEAHEKSLKRARELKLIDDKSALEAKEAEERARWRRERPPKNE